MTTPFQSADPPQKGRLITFEGGDGVGKSTQIRTLQTRFEALAVPVLATREPGGTERAEAIRGCLLTGRAAPYGTFAEAALFAAARADHVDRLIRPALARGTIVLCDRFIDSSRVYQGVLGGIASDRLDLLERAATGALRPDLTIVLDLPLDLAMQRAAVRRAEAHASTDRFEGEGARYQARVLSAFREIAAAEPGRCILVDASLSADAVAVAVWDAVTARLAGPTVAA